MNTCYLSCRRESSGISSLSAMNKTIKSPFFSKRVQIRQFETKRRQKKQRREPAGKRRRIDLCLQSTHFARCFYQIKVFKQTSVFQPSIVAAEDGSRDLVTADVILPSSKVVVFS